MRKISIILAISLVLALGMALQAAACLVVEPTSVIDQPKGTFSLAPPFADVFITVNGNTAHFDIFADQGYTIGDIIGFNLTQNNLTATNIDITNKVGTATFVGQSSDPNDTPNNVKAFGQFNLNLNFGPSNGFSSSFGDLHFDVTAPVAWANANSVLLLNQKQFDAYTHVFQGRDLLSGFAGEGPGTAAPIPGSVLLLGSGVLGLVGLRRKL